MVVGGSFAAQGRQVPPAAAIGVVGVILLVVAVAVLAWRRRWPRWVFAATVVIVGVYLVLGCSYGPIVLAASVAVFALASVDTAVATGIAVIGASVVWLGVMLWQVVATGYWAALTGAGALALWLVIPAWWAAVRARHRDAAVAAVQRHRHEIDEQRLELAREVHDVVAHNLTVIGVQTGAALRAFDRDPHRAWQALETIADTNRQALAELRETLDVLRSRDHEADTARGPVGGLAELPALIESARNTGTTVEFTAADCAHEASPMVQRTAYRIVQESLTNALRHAPGAAVTVAVERGPAELCVRVCDDGPGRHDRVEGRGILGMRERAVTVGGSLLVSGDDAGGVVVSAHLPLGWASS